MGAIPVPLQGMWLLQRTQQGRSAQAAAITAFRGPGLSQYGSCMAWCAVKAERCAAQAKQLSGVPCHFPCRTYGYVSSVRRVRSAGAAMICALQGTRLVSLSVMSNLLCSADCAAACSGHLAALLKGAVHPVHEDKLPCFCQGCKLHDSVACSRLGAQLLLRMAQTRWQSSVLSCTASPV